jgi:aryl-alcohol dehydrogenase-like predicted oxidoreductase
VVDSRIVRKRPLGKTGLNVSEFAVGTYGLSGDGYGKVTETVALASIAEALALNINLFETSDAYGAGAMEDLLGEALAAADPQQRAHALVATKIGIDRRCEPARRRFDAEYMEYAIRLSAKRLRRDRVDIMLLHHPSEEYLRSHALAEQMQDLRRRGLCSHWGVAAGNAAVAQLAIRQGAEVVELAYNLLHPADLHRISGDLLVERAGLLARSPLAYGLLSGSWTASREFADGDHRRKRWTTTELEGRVRVADNLRFLVEGDVTSLRGAAVRFVLASSVVSSVVLGPRELNQLSDLVRETGEGPRYLSDDAIRAALRVVEREGIEL